MTDWELQYQTGETPWDKGQPAPPLLEWLEKSGLPRAWENGQVLVPGCGLGHDVRHLAALGCQAVGLDISPTAVARAEAQTKVGGEVFELGDLMSPAWQAGRSFAGLWEHTCFCAIPPVRRADYAAAAGALIPPGGVLAGVFYLTPNDPGEEDEGPPFNSVAAEIESLFSPWFEKTEDWVPARSFPGRENREWLAVFRRLS